mmetsp:Transcript_4886/g.10757  ORF Transcript_4886/g.10757 Transcript_4886/m.10757 type:complete len:259 (+) Transcript_4886:307-1083(+)
MLGLLIRGLVGLGKHRVLVRLDICCLELLVEMARDIAVALDADARLGLHQTTEYRGAVTVDLQPLQLRQRSSGNARGDIVGLVVVVGQRDAQVDLAKRLAATGGEPHHVTHCQLRNSQVVLVLTALCSQRCVENQPAVSPGRHVKLRIVRILRGLLDSGRSASREDLGYLGLLIRRIVNALARAHLRRPEGMVGRAVRPYHPGRIHRRPDCACHCSAVTTINLEPSARSQKIGSTRGHHNQHDSHDESAGGTLVTESC